MSRSFDEGRSHLCPEYTSDPQFQHNASCSPDGEIGRHKGLKIPRPFNRPCRFDPGSGHQINNVYHPRRQFLYVSRLESLRIVICEQSEDAMSLRMNADSSGRLGELHYTMPFTTAYSLPLWPRLYSAGEPTKYETSTYSASFRRCR